MNLTGRLVALVPVLQRLRGSIDTLNHQVGELQIEQKRLACELSQVVRQLACQATALVATPELPTADVSAVPLFVPPGHYYSPIVKPADLIQQAFLSHRASDRLLGLNVDVSAMAALFGLLMDANGSHSFPEARDPAHRYFSTNEMYGPGDAMILAAMLRHFRPRRWIEVGSGFSSAALLDTLDGTEGLLTDVTFIEPNPERLDALLRGTDRARVTVMRSAIQDVPLTVFDSLAAGDVLFLDTTHVSKTGSDVNHELFQILPRLAAGVVIHLHDIFGDFEYPPEWIIEQNRSWNEQYLLRAFLMYNKQFEVLYANDGFARTHSDLIRERCPAILANPGGGFWMRKL